MGILLGLGDAQLFQAIGRDHFAERIGQIGRREDRQIEGQARPAHMTGTHINADFLFEAQRQREAAEMYTASRLDPEAFESRLFEWAYPIVARSRREAGRPYPELTEDGELVRGT